MISKFLLTSSRAAKIFASVSRNKWIPIDDSLFGLTPEESELRATSHKFFKQTLDPIAAEIDYHDQFPGGEPGFRKYFQQYADMGFFSLLVPEKYGGLCPDNSNGYMKSIIVGEELSRVSAGMALSLGAHAYLCLHQILKHGTEQQLDKYLDDLQFGKVIGALAMSEPNAGSDVVSMQCTAKKSGDKWILNGNKMWITNGPVADIYVIYAKTPELGKNKATAFIVDRREHPDTFKVGKPLDKLGIRGSPTGELIFENCMVDQTAVLGQPGHGFYVLMSGLNVERLVLSASPVGLMQACNDIAYSYAQDRFQFGAPIADNQLIQGLMADMYARCNSTRAYAYMIGRAADLNNYNNKDSAALVLMAAENGTKSALDCVQILGGNGYIKDYPAERMLRDAKLYEIGAGTSEVRRWLVGREINKEMPDL